MDILHTLTEQFKRFPGIGPRQAKRFAYFLFQMDQAGRETLADNIRSIAKSIRMCEMCARYFAANLSSRNSGTLCTICENPERDRGTLMVVSYDIDCENIERSGSYRGYYFILGGVIPILEKNPEQKVRLAPLMSRIEKEAHAGSLKEVILALNPTPDGENTQDWLTEALAPLKEAHSFVISTLGRGLSTGLELEYSDSDTITNSLKNRSKQ